MKKVVVLSLLMASLKCHALYVEINLTTPNTLSENIASSKKYLIDSLKVSGNISGWDVQFLRELCGAKSTIKNTQTSWANLGSCDPTEGKLEYLDLSDAHVGRYTNDNSYYLITTNSIGNETYHFLKEHTISSRMFMYCKALKKLVIPNDIVSIESYAFAKCENLSEIPFPDGILSIQGNAFDYCVGLPSLIIPDNCTGSSLSLVECCALKSIYLGKSFNSTESAFYNCTSLEKINVSEENNYITSIEGVLYTKDKKKMIAYPMGRNDEAYYVIDNVSSIGNSAFRNNVRLKNLHLPSSITNVDDYSFYGISLSNIWISASTPPSITSYSFGANWGEEDFRKSCVLYVPKGSYNSYWLAGGWGDFTSIMEFDGTDEILQCSAPQIALENGELHFTSETNGVRFFYSIDDEDIISNKESSGIVNLNASYNISVYAVAEGFTRSQTSYATIYWLDGKIENTSSVEVIQASKRAVLLSSHNGVISISGLNEEEEVALYSLSGVLLEKKKSHNHQVSFIMNQKENILICKVGNECIKYVLK